MSDIPSAPPPPPPPGSGVPQQPPPFAVPSAPPPAPPVVQSTTSTGAAIQLPAGVAVVSPWARLGAYLLEGVLIIVTFWIGWMIWAAMIAGTGQTPAKRLLGMRVIGADTLRPVSFGKMFWVRGILAGIVASIAVLFTLGVLLFMPFWDRRNQNIWDKVSHTYVVSDPHDVWATKPGLV